MVLKHFQTKFAEKPKLARASYRGAHRAPGGITRLALISHGLDLSERWKRIGAEKTMLGRNRPCRGGWPYPTLYPHT